MLCLFSKQGLTCSIFTAKNFARWRRAQSALSQARSDIVEVHGLRALCLLCLAAALSMAAAQKLCLDSWIGCAKDCSLAWSPADTAVSLLFSSSHVPHRGDLTQTPPPPANFCLCLWSIWASASCLGQTLLGFMLLTSKLQCPGRVSSIARCCVFVPKQGDGCVWLGKTSRHCLCAHY